MCLHCTDCGTIYKCKEAMERMAGPMKEYFKNLRIDENTEKFNGDAYACKKPKIINQATGYKCVKCKELEEQKLTATQDPEYFWRDFIATLVILNFDLSMFYKNRFPDRPFPTVIVRFGVD